MAFDMERNDISTENAAFVNALLAERPQSQQHVDRSSHPSRECSLQIRKVLDRYFPHTDTKDYLEDLLDCLDFDGSAVLAVAGSGLERTLVALAHTIDVALEAKEVSTLGDSSESTTTQRVPGRARGTKATPSAIVLVERVRHAEDVSHMLNDMFAAGQLALCCSDWPRVLHAEDADILVCTSDWQGDILRRVDLRDTKVVVWIEAHRFFPVELSNISQPPRGFRLQADETRALFTFRRLNKRLRFILAGPHKQMPNLAAIMDELLGTRGWTKTLLANNGQHINDYNNGSTECARSARSFSNDQETAGPLSPLLSLPGEIRNRTYEYSIESESVFSLTLYCSARTKVCRAVRQTFSGRYSKKGIFDHHAGKWPDAPASSTFALSRVNRQLAMETLVTHYERSTFDFDSFATLRVFLHNIGDLSRHVRHVRVLDGAAFCSTKPSTVFKKAERMLGIRSFFIDVESLRFPTTRPRHNRIDPICEFLASLTEYLLRWYRANNDKSGHSTVRDLIKFVLFCERCKKDLPDGLRKRSTTGQFCPYCDQMLHHGSAWRGDTRYSTIDRVTASLSSTIGRIEQQPDRHDDACVEGMFDMLSLEDSGLSLLREESQESNASCIGSLIAL